MPTIEDLDNITPEQCDAASVSLKDDLRNKDQKEPYKFEDFNVEGRIKVAMQFLDPRDENYAHTNKQIKYFLANRRFDDADEVPTILLSAIFGNKHWLLENIEKENITFETIADLTLTQKRVLTEFSADSKKDPMIENKNLCNRRDFEGMVDDFYAHGGEAYRALLSTTKSTKIIRSTAPITPHIPHKPEEGL